MERRGSPHPEIMSLVPMTSWAHMGHASMQLNLRIIFNVIKLLVRVFCTPGTPPGIFHVLPHLILIANLWSKLHHFTHETTKAGRGSVSFQESCWLSNRGRLELPSVFSDVCLVYILRRWVWNQHRVTQVQCLFLYNSGRSSGEDISKKGSKTSKGLEA